MSSRRYIRLNPSVSYYIRYRRLISVYLLNRQHLETNLVRCTTSNDSPSVTLLAIGRIPKRTSHVRYKALQSLLAAHGTRCPRICQKLAFVCLTLPNGQQTTKSSSVFAFRTIRVCGLGLFEPLPRKFRKSVHRCDSRPVFKTSYGDTDYSNNDPGRRSNIHLPLDTDLHYSSMKLVDNGPKFTSKFSQAACAELCTPLLMTTEYNPQKKERSGAKQ